MYHLTFRLKEYQRIIRNSTGEISSAVSFDSIFLPHGITTSTVHHYHNQITPPSLMQSIEHSDPTTRGWIQTCIEFEELFDLGVNTVGSSCCDVHV